MARVFGLTGGIACGKSTVAGFMGELGVAVIDADQVARDVVAPGSEGLRQIEQAFGAQVIAADGSLDRKVLGAIVFGDAASRAKLNAITHPLIRMASRQRAEALERGGAQLIAYEAALLVEVGQADAYRPLVVVVADEAKQLERLMGRDGIGEEEARKRIAAQMSVREKAEVGDYVIDTSASLEEVRVRTAEVVASIRATRSPDEVSRTVRRRG